MKTHSMVLEGPRKIVMKEFEIPKIGTEEGLLKVIMTGVCATDPKFYNAGFNAPLILGHEIFGSIAEIGKDASRKYGVEKDDHVVIDVGVSCGYCQNCQAGNPKFCRNSYAYGTGTNSLVPPHIWGAYGEYMYIAPNSVVHKISKDVKPEAAVLINALIANGIQWIRVHGQASIQDAVVIQGAGPQGLSAVIAAKESGASPVMVTGILPADEERFALAKEFGADYVFDAGSDDLVAKVKEITNGKMADVVLDVTGSAEGIVKSLDLIKQQGTLVCASIIAATKDGKDATAAIPIEKIVRNEIRFQGVFTSGGTSTIAAVKLVESEKYPFEKMVTHKFPLEKAEEALQAVGREIPGIFPIKAVLIP
ncbi:MAG: zinc-binding dehydrogenase [Deltaproteobacteria bacterium]|nr:zinc-binding dehydrogenase [Deltaproteobacteria bacterium]